MAADECVFCQIVSGKLPASFVLRTAEVAAFLDTRPLFKGHVLVVPVAHVDHLNTLPPELMAPVFAAVQRVSRAVMRALPADGTFVATNTVISQSVPHVHVHVVPRKKGDGLRGFFWPRTKYASDDERDAMARAIAAALEP
jgi:histidine triad (HIT) family protein